MDAKIYNGLKIRDFSTNNHMNIMICTVQISEGHLIYFKKERVPY